MTAGYQEAMREGRHPEGEGPAERKSASRTGRGLLGRRGRAEEGSPRSIEGAMMKTMRAMAALGVIAALLAWGCNTKTSTKDKDSDKKDADKKMHESHAAGPHG